MPIAIICLVFFATSATFDPIGARTAGAPGEGTQQTVDQEALKERILSSISEARLTVTPDGSRSIDALVARAMKQYTSARRAEAQKNADQLGRAIVAAAKDANSEAVTAAVVAAGLRDICPLWPFCD